MNSVEVTFSVEVTLAMPFILDWKVKMRTIVCILAVILSNTTRASEQEPLSEEFLNFLMDFDSSDKSEIDMLIDNGIEDANQLDKNEFEEESAEAKKNELSQCLKVNESTRAVLLDLKYSKFNSQIARAKQGGAAV